jgi:hypothetical protein
MSSARSTGIATAVVLAAPLGACGQATAPTTTSSATATPRATANATLPPSTSSTGPTEDANGPLAAQLNQPIRITCDGADCLDVTVVKVTTATRYKDPSGYKELDDVPKKGKIFVAVQLKYVAVGPDASFNPFDWGLYVNDEKVQDTAFASNGPEPQLSSGDLPKGKSVSGWVIWEVPTTGKVVISYEPGRNGSIFEVVLRPK